MIEKSDIHHKRPLSATHPTPKPLTVGNMYQAAAEIGRESSLTGSGSGHMICKDAGVSTTGCTMMTQTLPTSSTVVRNHIPCTSVSIAI